MLAMGDGRATIRHHPNALGEATEQLQPRAAAGIPTGADLQTLPAAAQTSWPPSRGESPPAF